MKEMKTLKLPNQDEPYEIVDAYAREQITIVASETLTSAHEYTDIAVANLVNSAPETLDTLGELSTALQENEEVVDVLNQAITTKYSADNPPPYPVTSVNGLTGAVVLPSETWTFTLADGSTVTKTVVIK